MLSTEELDKLKKAGRIAGQALRLGMDMVAENVKLIDVADEVESYIRKNGAKPSFPCNLSINEEAAHYTPCVNDKKRFELGDVVKVDVGTHIDGWIGDTAGTVEIGTKSYKQLIESSRMARDAVMEFVSEGCPMREIGRLIDATIKQNGFKPIRNLGGHEIRQYLLHAGLNVPNYPDDNNVQAMSGMILAIEPFATNGEGKIINGRPGNIFKAEAERPLADPELKEFFNVIKEEFRGLPFCERWCNDPKAGQKLNKLVRHGLIKSYPIFVEMKKGCVTQSEHTIYMDGKKAVITTLP